jgi:hypothetical protein
MQSEIPSTADVQARLKLLKVVELEALAVKTGVPEGTLWKIRTGTTANPGLETVRKFIDHLPVVVSSPVVLDTSAVSSP